MTGAARPWRIVFALVGWSAIALQYSLAMTAATRSLLGSTVVFFSFFTILTNVLVALAMTAPAVAPDGRLGRWTTSEGVRAAIAMYATVVGVIYHLFLHDTWNPQGLAWVANITLHYVMPAAMLLDWLLFVPKGRLRWIDALKWLAFPVIYGVWTVVHGALIGWYPYWFIDIGALGWGLALRNFAGLLVVFLVLGLVVVALDRGIGRRAPRPIAS